MSSHETTRASTVPRAIIHKRILDVAQSNPNRSIGGIATAVTGASETLVERVLDEYGDPAEETPPNPNPNPNPDAAAEATADRTTPTKTMTDASTTEASDRYDRNGEREPPSVTDTQRELLRAILDDPDASQRDLAEEFDVSQSTINIRLNSIDGFYWDRRREFAESILENGRSMPVEDEPRSDDPGDRADGVTAQLQALADDVADLSAQVATMEGRLESRAGPDGRPFGDPDLAARVVLACVRDDDISADEERRILTTALAAADPDA